MTYIQAIEDITSEASSFPLGDCKTNTNNALAILDSSGSTDTKWTDSVEVLVLVYDNCSAYISDIDNFALALNTIAATVDPSKPAPIKI